MTDPVDLPAAVIQALAERGQTLATAESLTGGLLGATITAVPGASKVYVGGVVTYATELKQRLLGVADADVAAFTVISPQVASGMARGVLDATGADWGIAVTGVAGPDPQDGHAPGEVWVAVRGRTPRGPEVGVAERFDFAGDRREIRDATVAASLALLLTLLSPV